MLDSERDERTVRRYTSLFKAWEKYGSWFGTIGAQHVILGRLSHAAQEHDTDKVTAASESSVRCLQDQQ